MGKDREDALNAIYPEDLEKEPVHKCAKCGRVFEEHDTDYLTFEGNVYVGEDGGIIGNNIPLISGTGESADLFKRSEISKTRICLSCFIKDVNEIKEKTLNDLKAKAEKTLNQIKQLSSDTTVDIPSFLGK